MSLPSTEVRRGRDPRAARTALVSDLLGSLRGGRTTPWWVRLGAINTTAVGFVALGALGWAFWVSSPIEVGAARASARFSDPALGVEFLESDDAESAERIRFSTRTLFDQPRERRTRVTRANVTLSELSRRLQLQGVLWGDAPRAIIYNASTKQVLHLSQGEFVGEIRIQEIRQSSVLLSWKEETIELIL